MLGGFTAILRTHFQATFAKCTSARTVGCPVSLKITWPAWSRSFVNIIAISKSKCADSGISCDFLTGMVSAIGLGAAVLYLFDYLKRSGRITF